MQNKINGGALGIYLHIPFCIKKCNYCDFCSLANSDSSLMIEYSRELARRIREFSAIYGKQAADTVYFGGGTPTLLPHSCFEEIFSALRDSFFVAGGSEITVECNPASIDLKGLEGLRSLGVNRLSIGLQSANDDELEMLGRVHSFDDFCVTYENARRAGFDNISVDLMYGLPLQTKDKLEYSLEKLIELSPEHISAYGLKIEEGTRFYKDRDSLALPDDDTCAEFYELCCERFAKSGYRRYEISNFSLDGRESRHNLKYWSLEDYVGFGVAAYSCFRGERFGNSRNIKGFLEGRDICEYRQKISNNDKISEYVMLGLRLERGISLEDYFVISGRELFEDYPTVKDFISKGFMKLEDGRLAFSTKGFLVSNIILSEILAFED